MTRLRRNLLAGLMGLMAAGLILLLTAWALFRSDPGWYRAVSLTPQQQLDGQTRIVDRLATLRNDVGRAQIAVEDRRQTQWPTFEFEITEDELNGFIGRWAGTDPQVKAALQGLDEPHVRFLDGGRVVIAGRLPGWKALLNVELDVTSAQDGSPRITLGRPWAGKLPLSRSLISTPALEGLTQLRKENSIKLPVAVIDAAEKLVNGEPTEPVIAIYSSLNTLVETRVEKLTVSDGVLKATLRPTGKTR